MVVLLDSHDRDVIATKAIGFDSEIRNVKLDTNGRVRVNKYINR